MRAISAFVFAMILMTPSLAGAVSPPCSCLQEMWFDLLGPNDIYIALSKEYDCNDAGKATLWWGEPSNPLLPQQCDNGNCEVYQDDDRREAQIFPGHGQSLVGAQAWEVYRVGLESAARKTPGLEFGSPSYHRISRQNIPNSVQIDGDMFIVAVPIVVHARGSRIDGHTYYLCIQIDSLGRERETAATFEEGKPGTGSQLHINYDVNGQKRTGLVWLK